MCWGQLGCFCLESSIGNEFLESHLLGFLFSGVPGLPCLSFVEYQEELEFSSVCVRSGMALPSGFLYSWWELCC